MIFAGYWGAEQREDAIARRLHDVAVIATCGVDHQAECRVNDRARFFGIEVLPELGRIHDVDKQGRNHFAFALWNRLRSDGRPESEAEVRSLRLNGRVGGRALGWRLPAKRHTTFIAEFCAGSIGCPATGTMQGQGCAAGVAEFRGLRILTIAAWTPHDLRRSSILQFVPMVLVPRQHGEGDENRTGKANAASVQMCSGLGPLLR